jgi:long-chain fatty acid transport protein
VTWAHNSVVDVLQIRFRGDPSLPGERIPVKGTPASVPPNADIPHHWKDVLGLRLGGDYVVLPARLALRAGVFFETKGQDDEWLNPDFHLGEKIGVSGGGTVRVGPVDISLAYQHTFFGALDNGGKGKVKALSGAANAPGYRSYQSVNGGRLESSLNEIALGGTVRF